MMYNSGSLAIFPSQEMSVSTSLRLTVFQLRKIPYYQFFVGQHNGCLVVYSKQHFVQ